LTGDDEVDEADEFVVVTMEDCGVELVSTAI